MRRRNRRPHARRLAGCSADRNSDLVRGQHFDRAAHRTLFLEQCFRDAEHLSFVGLGVDDESAM
jgi:hypothetical protein